MTRGFGAAHDSLDLVRLRPGSDSESGAIWKAYAMPCISMRVALAITGGGGGASQRKISTRRFALRPATDALDATGVADPKPSMITRPAIDAPAFRSVSQCMTSKARLSDIPALTTALPRLSECPRISMIGAPKGTARRRA